MYDFSTVGPLILLFKSHPAASLYKIALPTEFNCTLIRFNYYISLYEFNF